MSNSFLETGQHRLLVAGVDKDDTVRTETDLGQGRREEVLPGDAPEHLAFRSGGDAGREQGSRRTIDGGIAAAGNLVQRPERQAAAGQPVVYGPDPKRQNCPGAQRRSLKLLNLLAKATDCWAAGRRHPWPLERSDERFVLVMSSHKPVRVNRRAALRLTIWHRTMGKSLLL
jgi:hypothetical protein